MAEQKNRTTGQPGIGPSSSGTATEDALATMNDHLARFFQHADTLLREWQTYGNKVRDSIDAQVGALEKTVSSAVGEAGRAAALQLDSQVESNVAGSMAALRREIDTLARVANQTATRMSALDNGRGAMASRLSGPARWSPILWALVAANIMLAVLIGMSVRNCQAGRPVAGAAGQAAGQDDRKNTTSPAHASPTTAENGSQDDNAGAAPGLSSIEIFRARRADEICTTLASGYDGEAAEELLAFAVPVVCHYKRAPAVTETLRARLAAAGDSENPDKGGTGASRSGKDKTSSKARKRSGSPNESGKKPAGKKSDKSPSKSKKGKTK